MRRALIGRGSWGGYGAVMGGKAPAKSTREWFLQVGWASLAPSWREGWAAAGSAHQKALGLTGLHFLMEVNGLLILLWALQLSSTCFIRPCRVRAVQEPSWVPASCFGAGDGGGSGAPGVRGHRLCARRLPPQRHTEAFRAGCLNTGWPQWNWVDAVVAPDWVILKPLGLRLVGFKIRIHPRWYLFIYLFLPLLQLQSGLLFLF